MSLVVALLAGYVAGLALILVGQFLFGIARHLITITIEAIWQPRAIILGIAYPAVIPSKIKEQR